MLPIIPDISAESKSISPKWLLTVTAHHLFGTFGKPIYLKDGLTYGNLQGSAFILLCDNLLSYIENMTFCYAI